MRVNKIFLIGIAVVIIYCGMALAGTEGQDVNKTNLLPDLQVVSINFVPVPREGEPLDSVKISVLNQGQADAAKSTLGLSCTVIKCNEADRCSEASSLIQADIPVPEIKKGEQISFEWAPASLVRWPSGKYAVSASIDKYNAVHESNEANNAAKSEIYIKSFSPRAAVVDK